MRLDWKGAPGTVDDRRSGVIAMTRLGMSAAEIAVLLGVTDRTVQRDRAATGLSRPPAPPLTDAELARARALIDDGCSHTEVARTLGVHQTTVSSHFPGRGWTYAEAGHHGSTVRWTRLKAAV